MRIALDVLCGVSWCTVYIFAIIFGIKHKCWYIPAFSICMNFSWEYWVVVNGLIHGYANLVVFFVHLLWFVLDIGVILTWLIYDRNMSGWRKGLLFGLSFGFVFIVAFIEAQWLLSVFFINIIMSIEFLFHFKKIHIGWSGLCVAVGKLIGTLAATILNGIVNWNPWILWMGGLCFFLDLWYIFILGKSVISKNER